MTDTPRADAALHSCYIGFSHPILDLARQLERELAEARRDAERYRWIVGRRLIDEHFPEFEALWFNTNTPEELDAAIDEAMK